MARNERMAGIGLTLFAVSMMAATASAAPRILVGPRAGATDTHVEEAYRLHGGKEIGRIRSMNVRIVELPDRADTQAVIRAMKKHPTMKFAELDALVPPHASLNDPSLGSQWHITKMEAPAAWDISTGTGIVIAIIDTGVDGTHPDLAARMVAGWNMYDNNADASDVYGHGTAVAGTAAAIGNNAVGVAGVAWNASIMPVRISQLDGYAYFSTIASGLTWAADHGAKVANISYGVSGSSTVQSSAQYFKDKGGVTVVSAGNTSLYDATLASDTMISVAATNSSEGNPSWSTWGDFVDVSAPGESIYTTNRYGGYGSWSGTSFSSPATAGTIALMMAANPALDPATLETLLKQTAVDLGAAGTDQHFGVGRVNAAAAVLAAASSSNLDTTAPSASITNPLAGSRVSGLVAIDATASDNVGVTRVDLYAGSTLVASDTLLPYGFTWDSKLVADGAVNLTAYAYDAAGNVKVSSAVSVTVANAPDSLAPVVTITSPVNGAVASKAVTITASATDNVAVTKMSVLIDGVVKATSVSGAITYRWNTNRVTKGTHTIVVSAQDAAGNISEKTLLITK